MLYQFTQTGPDLLDYGIARTRTNFWIYGDFEVKVHLAQVDTSLQQYWYNDLYVLAYNPHTNQDDYNTFCWIRNQQHLTQGLRWRANTRQGGSPDTEVTFVTTHKTGWMKVRRAGNVFTAWYNEGSGWVQMLSRTLSNATGKPMRFRLGNLLDNTQLDDGEVYWDDFLVVYGDLDYTTTSTTTSTTSSTTSTTS